MLPELTSSYLRQPAFGENPSIQMNMAKVPDYGKAAQSPAMPKKSLPDTFDWSNVNGVGVFFS